MNMYIGIEWKKSVELNLLSVWHPTNVVLFKEKQLFCLQFFPFYHPEQMTFLVSRLQIPAKPNYSLVLYYAADRPVNKNSLLAKFMDGTDMFRDSRFKLIPSIVEVYILSWVWNSNLALICVKILIFTVCRVIGWLNVLLAQKLAF